jgi:hypothetical protein
MSIVQYAFLIQQTIFIQACEEVQYRVNKTQSIYPIFRKKKSNPQSHAARLQDEFKWYNPTYTYIYHVVSSENNADLYSSYFSSACIISSFLILI